MFRVLYALSKPFVRHFLGIYMWLRNQKYYCLSSAEETLRRFHSFPASLQATRYQKILPAAKAAMLSRNNTITTTNLPGTVPAAGSHEAQRSSPYVRREGESSGESILTGHMGCLLLCTVVCMKSQPDRKID